MGRGRRRCHGGDGVAEDLAAGGVGPVVEDEAEEVDGCGWVGISRVVGLRRGSSMGQDSRAKCEKEHAKEKSAQAIRGKIVAYL